MNLEVVQLNSGRRLVRPLGAVGNVGWHPMAWTAAYISRNETPEQAFIKANPKWKENK